MVQTNRVLLVDDSPINLRIIERQLQGLGLSVTTASGGQEALEAIKSMEFDGVFMDHLMPGMDGIETLHAIRRMEGDYYRKVPVVVLTANEAGEARETFLAEGFDAFLQKPTTKDTLETVVTQVFQKNAGEGAVSHTEEIAVGIAENDVADRLNQGTETTSGVSKESAVSWEDWEPKLLAAGLDVKTALLYCGGEDSYVDIVQYYGKARERTERELTEAFEREDWETYTIAVHAIKSGLRSIGATALSEEARRLEMAGRTGEVEYIPAHHEAFLMNYRELFLKLEEGQKGTSEKTHPTQTGEDSSLKELSEEAFGKLLDEMEEAAYDWDGPRLTELVTSLGAYRYKGAALAEAVEAVERKLQKSDYVSAVETIRQWK